MAPSSSPSSQSLAVRLGVLAAGGSLVALVMAGAIMAALQRAGAERAFDERLSVFVTQLFADYANNDLFDATAHFANPAFGLPGSGWYWVVGDPRTGDPAFASASLFDPLPPPRTPPAATGGPPQGPVSRPLEIGGQRLRLIDRVYNFEGEDILIRVAAPTNGLDMEIRSFRIALAITLGAMWLALLALAFLQVRIGLRPLQHLQQSVADVRTSKTPRVEGRFPTEVSPLVEELNALLSANEAIVERARHHVGNLAHALKTPLAVILNSARGTPNADALARIQSEAQSIDDRVRLYLDRAQRAATQATSGQATGLKAVLDPLVRTMVKLNRDKDLVFDVSVEDAIRLRADEQDLEEMLGNLLENACRHAAHKVAVSVENQSDGVEAVTIHVDDDGAGLDEAALTRVLERGQRLDQTSPGSGLGLSIVNEMATLYAGSFVLARAPMGGLRASLTLPSAAPVPPES